MTTKARCIGGRIIGCIRAPLRGLCRVRNYYVRSMTSFAARFPSADAICCNRIASDEELSFCRVKLSSGESDLRELIRFASQSREAASREAVRRNLSVAVGRIEENGSFDFAGEARVGESLIFPTSHTCAVGRKRAAAAVVPV